MNIDLLPWNKVLDYVCNIYNNTYPKSVKTNKDLRSYLEDYISLVDTKTDSNFIEKIESIYEKNILLLKKNICKISIPHDVELTEYRVKPLDRNESDDNLYINNPHIQHIIPRGLTLCKYKDYEPIICIYSNRKFTEKKDYFLHTSSQVTNIVRMEKINGEALHFSVRYIDNKFYLFVGSKNNHIIIHTEEDIKLYTEERFVMAKLFASKLWHKLYNEMSKDDRLLLYSFLHHTKMTAVCELLDKNNQHMIPINLDKIVFLLFTAIYNHDQSLTSLPPHLAINIMEIFQFQCANIIDITNDCNDEEIIESLKYAKNTEGEVLYYLDKQGNCLGLVKEKTVWYVCLRALRELAKSFITSKRKNNDKVNIHNIESKIHTRYEEIKLRKNLTEDYISNWKQTAEGFIKWLDSNYDNSLTTDKFTKKFINFYNEYEAGV